MVAPMRRVALSIALLMGCERATGEAPAPVQAPAVAWVDVDTKAELLEVAARAATERKGLMLDVRADWCVPCKELEQETFTDEAVRKALHARFITARLDVTEPSPEAVALQGMVGGAAMPWVVFWSMTDEDAKAFAQGELPPPTRTVGTFVSAEELRAVLP